MTEETKELYVGERRDIGLKVWLNSGESFIPTECTWSLMLNNVEESSGSCTTEPLTEQRDSWMLTAQIQPQLEKKYKLAFQFNMGSEIVIRKIFIKAVK